MEGNHCGCHTFVASALPHPFPLISPQGSSCSFTFCSELGELRDVMADGGDGQLERKGVGPTGKDAPHVPLLPVGIAPVRPLAALNVLDTVAVLVVPMAPLAPKVSVAAKVFPRDPKATLAVDSRALCDPCPALGLPSLDATTPSASVHICVEHVAVIVCNFSCAAMAAESLRVRRVRRVCAWWLLMSAQKRSNTLSTPAGSALVTPPKKTARVVCNEGRSNESCSCNTT